MKTAGTVLQSAIGGIWLWSATSKLLALDEFRSVLEHHAVIPDALMWAAFAVPVAEVLVGAAIVSLGLRYPWSLRALKLSMLVAIGLLCYIVAVPAVSLRNVGCGCGGPVEVLGEGDKAKILIADVLFILVHIAALVIVWRERPSSRQLVP